MRDISIRHDAPHTNGAHSVETFMPSVSKWREFTKEDGTVVKCLIDGNYLELVVIEDRDGHSLDIPPDMVDMSEIEEALNLSLRLH